jgi:hypothetical protein
MLLNCCHGLVVIDQETSTVRLVHYSLQEYLQQQTEVFKVPTKEWHGRMAATCITFLTFPPLTDREEPTAKGVQSALLRYSAKQRGHHLRYYEEVEEDQQVQKVQPAVFGLAYEYLQTDWEANPESWRLLYRGMYRLKAATQRNRVPGHIGAFFGVRYIILHLDSTGVSLDMSDILKRTPLSWASENGHETVVRLLIEKGAAVDSTDEYGQTSLLWASRNGHEAVGRKMAWRGP